MANESTLLTLQDVAERLRCSPDLVRKLCNSRKLGHVRIGNRYRITESDLTAYVASQRRVPEEATSSHRRTKSVASPVVPVGATREELYPSLYGRAKR